MLAPVIVSLEIGDELRGCIPNNRRKRSRFRVLVPFALIFDCDIAQTIARRKYDTVKVKVVGYRGILNRLKGSGGAA